MVRRLSSAFELEAFDGRNTASRRLERFLDVYIKYSPAAHRTETNQLLHYLDNPLPGRRIIYFGLSFEGEPCGFCVLMCYAEEAVGIFDFVVIAPNRRGHGAFFALCDLVASYLERQRIRFNYLVAEVLLDAHSVTHGITSKLLIRLLRFQRFRLAKIPYLAPDPTIVLDTKSCRAALMVAAEPDTDSLTQTEYMRLLKLIYLNHYYLWYSPFMSGANAMAYQGALNAELTKASALARSRETIVLNGMRDIDIALSHEASPRYRYFTVIFGCLSAMVTVAVGFAQSPTVTGAVAFSVFIAIGVGLLSRRLRRWVFTAFLQRE